MRWSADAYRRDGLPDRVLMFGTGMLLRSLVATAVDDANREHRFRGGIVAVQTTPHGNAQALNDQDGLFTLVERGLEHGQRVERMRMVGSVTRALVAQDQWPAIRDVAANPAVRAIVSNVTEAGFALGEPEAAIAAESAPASFPGKLADLLYTRFVRAPGAPPLTIIPTELVPHNGTRLQEMISTQLTRRRDGTEFRAWVAQRVQICASLVDRITTGPPTAADHAALTAQLGYADSLITITEPAALWAIEGERAALEAALPIDNGERIIFAPDITPFRERKLRLLNGAHTAMAPLAVLAGIPTVRDATDHTEIGLFFRQILFGELVPGSGVPLSDAESFAQAVWDRFRNPWIDHAWSTISTNQRDKMRIRVAPSITGYFERTGRSPAALTLATAAHLRFLSLTPRALADDALWGAPLGAIGAFVEATTHWWTELGRIGAAATVAQWRISVS